MDHLSNLNKEQIEAVTATEGAIRVTAGPGTGKTRTLTRRYCYLVDTLGVNPANILCATFTNKAANEMKSRIRERLGDLDLGYISTIHGFCHKLLKEDINVLGYPKNFVILDDIDQQDIMDQIFEEMNLKMTDLTIKSALDSIIEEMKLTSYQYIEHVHLLNNENLRLKFLETKDLHSGIFLRYLYKQKKSFGLDFNDLINFASYILDNFPLVAEKWRKRLQYVMVDEFQDVSLRQYKLMDSLSAYHENIFIVGDPDQTIYSWRGSHVKLFLDFTDVHQPSKSVSLPTNYRSTDQIIRACGSLIAHNIDRLPYKQVGLKPYGDLPLYYRAKDIYDEASWVAGEVKKLIAMGTELTEIAVIYRAHHLSRPIEEKFIGGTIPYRLFSGTAFYSRKEIKDMVSYLRMLTAADDVAFRRTINTPRRNIGKKTLEFLSQEAEYSGATLYQTLLRYYPHKRMANTLAASYVEAIEELTPLVDKIPMSDLFQRLMDKTGYEAYLRLQGDQERLDNAAELKRAILDFGQDEEVTVDDFLARTALFTDLDNERPEKVVKLLSIHSAKGLEFDAVFLIGLSEGSLPSHRALTPEEMAEERRLCYVAMTRAREKLFLSNSTGRAHEKVSSDTSRFIFEIDPDNLELLRHPGIPPKDFVPRDGQKILPRLIPGQMVSHASWGQGKIIAVSEKETSYLVQFDNLKTPRNLRFDAPLKIDQ
jgi:DNA helicase-2/ATP-dependent DNA helicase PcrA